MKYWFLASICLLSLQAQARIADTTLPFVTLNLNYLYGVPQGQFAAQNANRFLVGHCLPNWGGEFNINLTATKHLRVGFCVGHVAYKTDAKYQEKQIQDRYLNSDYYTNFDMKFRKQFGITTLTYRGTYLWQLKGLEIASFLDIGIGIPSDGVIDNSYTVIRKKKNENFSETVHPDLDTKAFFYPGLGVTVNKRIFEALYFSAGVRYNYGTLHYNLCEEREDFIGNVTSTSNTSILPISSVTIHAGIQLNLALHDVYHSALDNQE